MIERSEERTKGGTPVRVIKHKPKSNTMADVIKQRTLKILNQSKTHTIFKSNLYLDMQVHIRAVTKEIFSNAMQELVDDGEIEIEENLIKRSDKKFLQVAI